jgi:hypothetical protein
MRVGWEHDRTFWEVLMLKMKHRQEATSTEHDEQSIREDERRRVMEELRGEDRTAADGDWRTTPPAFDEPHYDDPRDVDRRGVADDPRAWDLPDDRREARPVVADRHDGILEQRPWAVEEETVVERGFSPGQILLVLAGVASLALGIAAVAVTGLSGPLSEPVDEVLGWNHTALLGLIEIGAGVVMILSGLRAGARWIGGLVGLAAIVGGALILGRLDWTMNELGAERSFGWVAIAIGAVAVIGAAIPRVRRRSRRVAQTHSSQLLMH